jgi:hypothetical protein
MTTQTSGTDQDTLEAMLGQAKDKVRGIELHINALVNPRLRDLVALDRRLQAALDELAEIEGLEAEYAPEAE